MDVKEAKKLLEAIDDREQVRLSFPYKPELLELLRKHFPVVAIETTAWNEKELVVSDK